MMVPKKSLILAGAALAMLGSASAQSVSTGKAFSRINKPLKSASLDLATGTVTRGPVSNNRGGNTIADFQNLDLNGFIGVDTGGGACKWFSAGLKGSGSNQSTNASDLMNNIVFAYCSSALDVNSGGVGGTATLGFYEGYTVFGGAPTTSVAVFTLTGLPANTASSSFQTGRNCFLLTVNFANLVAFRDSGLGSHQGIGYSWTFDDLGTDGTWAATYPFFACMTSCSGAVVAGGGGIGSIDGQGMTDAIDQYCPPGVAVPFTFTFGTTNPQWTPSTWTTVSMQIQEAADRLTTNVNYNATNTPNADTLTATAATIGTTWTATWTRSPASTAGSLTVRVRTSKSLPNGSNPTPPVTGRVLITGTLLSLFPSSHNGTTGSVASPIPLQLGFCGIHFTSQATAGGGGLKLSSAVEGTTGTF
jgi:hypothetical protein